MAIAALTLARRLRAGETVFSGWCGLPYPLVAETLARDGFSAVAIEKPARALGYRRHPRRHRRDCQGRRRADRARAA